jgi:AcrR family transcriptional regulator
MVNTKRELKREQILEAATALIKKKHYDEVRVEDIAKAANMAKSMIFYYFTSKASVYLKILHNLHVQLVQDVIRELEQAVPMSGEGFKGFESDHCRYSRTG